VYFITAIGADIKIYGECIKMKNFFNWLMDEESGQGMVEYGLIIALIAVFLIVALTAMGGGLSNIFGKITAKLQ
jgi:pilus assembly protein Flp/PilA